MLSFYLNCNCYLKSPFLSALGDNQKNVTAVLKRLPENYLHYCLQWGWNIVNTHIEKSEGESRRMSLYIDFINFYMYWVVFFLYTNPCPYNTWFKHLLKLLKYILLIYISFIRRVRKILKSFVMSICTSFRPHAWNNSSLTGRILSKFDIWVFFENLSRKSKFH